MCEVETAKRKSMLTLGIILGIILSILGYNELKAQYRTTIGVRAGGTSGIAIKHNYGFNTAFEGIVGIFNDGFSLTGLIEKHTAVSGIRGLHWYYGGGAHLAFYDRGDRFTAPGREIGARDRSDIGFGINGIGGLEYVFDDIPIALSLDLKPFVEVDTDGDVAVAPDPGFGIKLLLK